MCVVTVASRRRSRGLGEPALRFFGDDLFFSVGVPPGAMHSVGVLTITPWPLHWFRPLQPFFAVAHRRSPLQALMP